MSSDEALPTLLLSRPKTQQFVEAVQDAKAEAWPRGRRPLPEALEIPEAVPAAPREATAPETPGLAAPLAHHGLLVRNTFIDGAVQRSPSLEAFYRERQVSTCPSKHVGRLAGIFQETLGGQEGAALAASLVSSPCGIQTPCNLQEEVVIHNPLAVLPSADGYFGSLPWYSAAVDYSSYFDPYAMDQVQASFCGMPDVLMAGMPLAAHHAEPFAPLGQARPVGPVVSLEQALGPLAPMAAGVPLETAFAGGVLPEAAAMMAPPLPAALAGQLVEQHAFPPWLGAQGGPACEPFLPAPAAAPAPGQGADAGDALGALGLHISSAPSVPPTPPAAPAPGSLEFPSLGSAGHAGGQCKPCAFLHTKGCGNGLACNFCHLCRHGEKKRRQRDKSEMLKAIWQEADAPPAARAAPQEAGAGEEAAQGRARGLGRARTHQSALGRRGPRQHRAAGSAVADAAP